MDSFRRILETKLASEKDQVVEIDLKTIQFVFGKIIQNQYGAQGKSNVLPLAFKDQILTLGVYKSLWQSEITLVKDALIQALNEELGSDCIKDIRIQRK